MSVRLTRGYDQGEILGDDGGNWRNYAEYNGMALGAPKFSDFYFGDVGLVHGYARGEVSSLGDFGTAADDAISSAIAQLRDIQADVRAKADSVPSFPSQMAGYKAALYGWADQVDRTISLMPDWAADPTKFQRGMDLVQKTLQQGRDAVNNLGTVALLDDKFVAFMSWLPQATKDGLDAFVSGAGEVLQKAAFNITIPLLILGGGILLLVFGAKKAGVRGGFGPLSLNGYGGRRGRRRRTR